MSRRGDRKWSRALGPLNTTSSSSKHAPARVARRRRVALEVPDGRHRQSARRETRRQGGPAHTGRVQAAWESPGLQAGWRRGGSSTARRTGTRRGRPPIHSLCGGHSRCGGVSHRPGRSWASSVKRPGKTLRLRPDSTTRSVPHCAARPAAAPGAAGRSGSSGEPGEEPCERVSRQTGGWAASPEFPLSSRGIVRRDEELNKIGFAPVLPVRNRPPAQFERSTHFAQPATPSLPHPARQTSSSASIRQCDLAPLGPREWDAQQEASTNQAERRRLSGQHPGPSAVP